jgi:hypothetical protein
MDPLHSPAMDPLRCRALDPLFCPALDPLHSLAMDPLRCPALVLHSPAMDPLRCPALDPLHNQAMDPLRCPAMDPLDPPYPWHPPQVPPALATPLSHRPTVKQREAAPIQVRYVHCTSCNGPGFDHSIRRHSGI